MSHAACLVLHVLEGLFSPPARYPDLFPVLNVLISTPVFALVWLWSIRRGVEVGWALGGLGSKSTSDTKPAAKKEANGHEGTASISAATNDHVGIGRETGARTVSLGYAQGRRRHVRPHRTGSISSVLSTTSHVGRELDHS